MIYVINNRDSNPEQTNRVAMLLEEQAGAPLEDILEHREVVHVKFLDEEGYVTDEFYEADDWFGTIELTRLENK